MPPALSLVLGVLAVTVQFFASACQSPRASVRGLPPRFACLSAADAVARADLWQHRHGGELKFVMGTGSMAPYIAAAKPGADPETTVVALAITDRSASYDTIEPGALCLYRAGWCGRKPVLHSAALKSSDGWIMTGLHNRHYESAWRMTRADYLGRATAVFTWPP